MSILPSTLQYHYLRMLDKPYLHWSQFEGYPKAPNRPLSIYPLQSVKAWHLQSSGGIPAFLLLFSCTSHLCFFFSPLTNRDREVETQGPKQNSGPLSRHSPHQNNPHITVTRAHKRTIKASLFMSNSPSHTEYDKIQGEGDEVHFVEHKHSAGTQ